ncbi:hypothetical protein DPMN_178428 [Dreissena polymorpha]|uniref:Uncharacterized protein n=1 Tax=Dreissena polymorpha TaxID=45954 RepID=A0A9D4EAK5_DREPO|nr:hypothetical protein DPMN_178428 [Dreissena polymorpha]
MSAKCQLLKGLPKLDLLKGRVQMNVGHLSSRFRGISRITQTKQPMTGEAQKTKPENLLQEKIEK